MEWYLKVLKNYAEFTGRARRKEFWMFTLIHLIITYGLIIVGGVFELGFVSIIAGIYIIGTIVPNLAVSVRRLHDTGKSGWWILISFVPFIGGIWFLVLAATEGDSGANAYGPDPKGSDAGINEIGLE